MNEALASNEAALRAFCARLLGWSDEQAVDIALRSIHLSLTRRVALVLLGDHDLVPIALALHRRTLGAEHPFIVCDPRRANRAASIRSPMNYESGVAAVRAAVGGSLCMRQNRMPCDFPSMAALVKDPAAFVQIIVCAEARFGLHPFLLRPAPIRVPPLSARASELPRIVDEYALDAIRELSANETGLPRWDREWVIERSASTLSEIEKATRRLVAIRQARSWARAAARLGMSHVALQQWFERRGGGALAPDHASRRARPDSRTR